MTRIRSGRVARITTGRGQPTLTNPKLSNLKKMFKLDSKFMRTLTVSLDKNFTRLMRRAFLSDGAATGAKWAALNPKYRKWKEKQKVRGGILVLKGAMAKSLFDRRSRLHIARSTTRPPVVELGTRSQKAVDHSIGRGTRPDGVKNAGKGKKVARGFGKAGTIEITIPVRNPIQMTADQLKGLKNIVKIQLRLRMRKLEAEMKQAGATSRVL